MTRDDLDRALDWAREEGWNPGLEDAAAFHAADPTGFLMGTLDGDPVSSISVVKYGEDFAFLGLYICRPDLRGRGYGMRVWRAGMEHAGDRVVGLDGVPAQQVALAGRLRRTDLAIARDAGADIAGVRGAACEGGRTGTVTSARVRELVDLVRADHADGDARRQRTVEVRVDELAG